MNSRFGRFAVSWEVDSQPGHGAYEVTRTDRMTLLVAEGFGLGRLKPAPGTWGSLWGIPIGWCLCHFALPWWQRIIVALGMFVVGVPLCSRAAALRKTKDPGSVVWDEMAAFPIVFAFAPMNARNVWPILVTGFLLFRVFDIWKPSPVRQCDRLTGGFGIMIDDTLAAAYASAALWLLVTFTAAAGPS